MTTASSPPPSRRCVSAGYRIASDGPQTAVDGLRYITERPASPSSAGPAALGCPGAKPITLLGSTGASSLTSSSRYVGPGGWIPPPPPPKGGPARSAVASPAPAGPGPAGAP